MDALPDNYLQEEPNATEPLQPNSRRNTGLVFGGTLKANPCYWLSIELWIAFTCISSEPYIDGWRPTSSPSLPFEELTLGSNGIKT